MIEREELTFYLGRLHARTGSQKINVFLQKRKNLTIFSETVWRGKRVFPAVTTRGVRFPPTLSLLEGKSTRRGKVKKVFYEKKQYWVQRRALKIACCKIKRVSKLWHKLLISANNESPECVLRLIFHTLNQVRCKLIQVQSDLNFISHKTKRSLSSILVCPDLPWSLSILLLFWVVQFG